MIFNSTQKTPYDASQQVNDAKKILGTLQPVLDKVYSNKAALLFSNGFDWIEEFVYYIFALACFVFIFIMNSVFPFHVLGEIVSRPVFREHISNVNDIHGFDMAVKGLVVLIGILFIMLGFKKRTIRKNKTMLYSASAELKKVENYLSEKVAKLNELIAENPAPPDVDRPVV